MRGKVLLGAALRLLAAGLLIAALSASVSAYLSYQIIDGTPFTDPNPAASPPLPASPPAPGPALVTTLAPPDEKAPSRDAPWLVGSCVTDWLPTLAVECTTYKALRIVGVIHAPDRGGACGDIPESADVRYPGRYTLCLAPP